MSGSTTVVMDSGNSTEQPPVEQPPIESVETNKGVQFTGEPPAAPERPEWLPPKFSTPEELSKAYSELESKLGSASGNRIAPAPAPTPNTATAEEISFAPAVEEFQKDGAISDKTYAKLAEKGLSKAVIDSYIVGQQALAERQTASLAEAVGGTGNLKSVLEWAGKNLTQAEMDGYNSQIDSGNIEAAKVMLSAFNARFVTANGSAPKLINGAPAKTNSEGGFQSQAEMLAAMRDPRYRTDPAYVNSVIARLQKTTAF